MTSTAPHPPLLLVNHFAPMNQMVRRLLDMHGYENVDIAETLAAARSLLNAAGRQHYALLLCRNALADGCAGDLIPYAWAHFHTPTVVMTGTLTRDEVAARVTPAEALRGVLLIPFSAQTLLSVIRTACAPPVAMIVCPDCRGSGEITLLVSRRSCRRCQGTGKVREAAQLAAPSR